MTETVSKIAESFDCKVEPAFICLSTLAMVVECPCQYDAMLTLTLINFQPVEGMLSHQLEQNRIDGEKTIIQNPSEAQRKEHEKFEFSVHEVYAVDVLITSGEGLGREKDAKITVYKKTDDTYMLKMKTSREFYSKVSKQFGPMPFNIRNMEDEKKARMGVVECVTHRLIEPFQVLFDKEGERPLFDVFFAVMTN